MDLSKERNMDSQNETQFRWHSLIRLDDLLSLRFVEKKGIIVETTTRSLGTGPLIAAMNP